MIAKTPKRRNMNFSNKLMIPFYAFLWIFLPNNEQKLNVTTNCIEDELGS